jgi:hypothetical protein
MSTEETGRAEDREAQAEAGPAADALPPSSLGRAREIASVLRRHGLWNLIEAFGLRRHLPFQRSRRAERTDGDAMDPAHQK